MNTSFLSTNPSTYQTSGLFSVATAAAASFTPTDIANCVLWLDASQETFNNDDAVGTWTDRSGSGNNATQGTGSLKPLFKTNQVNSLPAIKGDGTDDYLRTPSMTGSQTQTWFFVAKPVSSTKYTFSFDTGQSKSLIYGFEADMWEILNSPTRVNVGTAGSAFQVLSFRIRTSPSDQTQGFKGGTQTESAATATTLDTAVRTIFGPGDLSTAFFDGYFAEIIGYSASLSDADMTTVTDYLKTKYAL